MEEIIDFLGLANYREQRISGLPYGVRKVVELARALCAEPKLLLLDEPASGLNTEETEEVAFWIEDIKNDLGVTVIMIEHDMSLVSAVSNRVLALNNGRTLALGTPERGAVQPGRDRGLSRERSRMSGCIDRVPQGPPPPGGRRTTRRIARLRRPKLNILALTVRRECLYGRDHRGRASACVADSREAI